jgi:hypothetical protein
VPEFEKRSKNIDTRGLDKLLGLRGITELTFDDDVGIDVFDRLDCFPGSAQSRILTLVKAR